MTGSGGFDGQYGAGCVLYVYMAIPEADALGYLSPAEVEKLFGDLPFGPDRLLTVFEEGDMLLCGFKREEITGMTPSELSAHADMIADLSDLLIGA